MKKMIASFTLTALQVAHIRHHLSLPSLPTGDIEYSSGLRIGLEEAGLFEEKPSPASNLFNAADMSDPMAVLSGMMGIFSQMAGPAEHHIDTNAPDKLIHLTLSEDEANELTGSLISRLGIFFTQEFESSDTPATSGAKIIAAALDKAFPSRRMKLSLDDTDVEISAPEPALDESSSDVQIGIANECDGDIAGFYLFDNASLNALDAHQGDTWDFLAGDNAKAPARLGSLSQVFTEIHARGLNLTGEFGICVY